MSGTFFSVIMLLLGLFAASCTQTSVPLNVLLIIVDDLNTDLGTYGHNLVNSPHIDRLAARGVRFDRAYCQYPVCSPSRSSFLTGLYPEQTGVLTNQDSLRQYIPDIPTLPQWFRENGYYTARVGKIFHYGVPMQIGSDGMDDPVSWSETVNPRGIDREVHDRIHTLVPNQYGGTLSWLSMDPKDGLHTDELGAAAAIQIMEEQHPSRTDMPLFLAVGFYRPHTPFVAPTHYFELYSRDQIDPVLEQPSDRDDIPIAALADRPKQRELTMEKRREIIQAYYASVSFMDAQVGRLLDALERLNMVDHTIVVFVSDHGYHLGHHGLWQKGDLFEGSVRVPLIIATPERLQKGSGTEALTELVDLYPTLVDLSGLPAPEHLKGSSLRLVLEDTNHPGRVSAFTVGRSRAAWMHPEMNAPNVMGYSIRTDRFRYTEWDSGNAGAELYDYEVDPMEIENLVNDPAYTDTLGRLKRLMELRKQAAK
ncbi:MAG: sulfatase [Bacteroidetes bacterium]|nr:sulfatase [Bacteroidota bacterium]